MQVLKEQRSGKALTVEVIDEDSSGLDSKVRVSFLYIMQCPTPYLHKHLYRGL